MSALEIQNLLVLALQLFQKENSKSSEMPIGFDVQTFKEALVKTPANNKGIVIFTEDSSFEIQIKEVK